MRLQQWLLLAGVPLLTLSGPSRAQVVTGPPVNLTEGSITRDYMGKISRNGEKVTFTREIGHFNGRNSVYDVYVMNPDGSDKTWVRFPGDWWQEEWSAISPDGTKVAFQSWTTGGIDIYVVDLSSGQSFRMTNHAKNEVWPNWSPDGKKLVFQSLRVGDTTRDYQAFILNAVDDAGNVTPESETNVPVQVTNFNGTTAAKGYVTRPSFSADGTRIFFAGKDAANPNFDIYVADIVDSDGDGWGDNKRKIVNLSAIKPGYAGIANPEPTQMTVGGPIFFTSGLAPDAAWGRLHIFRINEDGTGLWQVTGADYSEENPYAGAGKLLVNITSAAIGSDNADVGMYTLTDETGEGVLRGQMPISADPSVPLADYTIEAYNGPTKVNTATTDAEGKWSMTLPPGGYTLYLNAAVENPVQITKIYRGIIVPPNGNVEFNFFTTVAGAPRVTGTIATIKDGKVSVVWLPVNPPTGFALQGFNIYRATGENGPWTKINTSLVAAAQVNEFIDEAPGDLTSAFYAVTAVALKDTLTLESYYSDPAQAANNLVFNPSFEQVNASGSPLGWELEVAANVTSTMGTDPAAAVSGSRSAYIQAGDTKGNSAIPMAQAYFVPTKPYEAYVEGVFAKFQEAKTAKPAILRGGFNLADFAPYFKLYRSPWTATPPSYSAMDSSQLAGSTSNGNQNWKWLFNMGPVFNYEFSPQVRLSPWWTTDATTTTTSRAYFDEVRYQVKRVGATGIVWGRVVNSEGVGVSGVKVTDGTRTAYSGSTGAFILRDVPTGPATVSVSYPGQTTVTETFQNIGGYRFANDIVYTGTIQTQIGGRILLPSGAPAAGAKVRIVVGNYTTDGSEQSIEATTDANGEYIFANAGSLDTTKKAWVVATKGGYQSVYVKDQGLTGVGMIRFDLTLGPAVPEIQVARATGAITIDGQMNEAAWQNAMPVSLAFKHPTTDAPDVPATGYMLWDDDKLYVAFEASEPNMAGIKAGAFGPNAVGHSGSPNNVFADDHMELFLDPTVSAAIGFGREVWQIGANANTVDEGTGDTILRTGPDPIAGVNGYANDIFGLAVQAATSTDKWALEMAIPFADMSTFDLTVTAPTVGTQWRGIIARYRSQDGQYSSSTFTNTGGFAAAEKWNTLTFVTTVQKTKGDLTGDNLVTAADVIEALKVSGGITALGSRLPQGDVAGSDGKVDLQDASRILRSLNGLDSNL